MNKSKGLKILGVILAIGGFALNQLGNYVNEKTMEEMIDQKLDEREEKKGE